jgi:AraC family transcriptional regulator
MTTERTPSIEPRIERQDGFLLAGLSERFTMARRHEIPRLWTAFGPQIALAPERIGEETFGAMSFHDDGFDYFAAVRVWDASRLPEGWTSLRLASRKIAVFRHPGSLATLYQTLDAVHAWSLDAKPGTGGAPQLMEIYGADFDPATGRGTIEVALSIAD